MGQCPNSSRKGQSWATFFVAQLLLWRVLEGILGQGALLAHFGLWLRLARREDAKGSGPPNWISLELLAVKMAAHEASTGDGITGRGSLKEKTAVCYPQQLRLLCLDNGPSHGQRFFGVPEEGTSF